MFFGTTVHRWKTEQEEALLKKKEAALKETLSIALFGFLFGIAGTVVLSAICYWVILGNIQMMEDSSKTTSAILTLLIGYNLPIYMLLLLGFVKMVLMTFSSPWILIRFAFVKADAYDLENEPSFRV